LQRDNENPSSKKYLSKRRDNDSSQAQLLDDTAKVIVFAADVDQPKFELPEKSNDLVGDNAFKSGRRNESQRVGNLSVKVQDFDKELKQSKLTREKHNGDSDGEYPAKRLGTGEGDSDGVYDDTESNGLSNQQIDEKVDSTIHFDDNSKAPSKIKSREPSQIQFEPREPEKDNDQPSPNYSHLIEQFVKKYASHDNLTASNRSIKKSIYSKSERQGPWNNSKDQPLTKEDTLSFDSDSEQENEYALEQFQNEEQPEVKYKYFNSETGLFDVQISEKDDQIPPIPLESKRLRNLPLVPTMQTKHRLPQVKEYSMDRRVRNRVERLFNRENVPKSAWEKNDAELKKIGFLNDQTDPFLYLKNTPLNSKPEKVDSQNESEILELNGVDHIDYYREPFGSSKLADKPRLNFKSSSNILTDGDVHQADRYWSNRVASRLASAPYYLEIVYEETEDDEGKPTITENHPYENPVLERLSHLKQAMASGSVSAKHLPQPVRQQIAAELMDMIKQKKVAADVIIKRSEEVGLQSLGGLAGILRSTDTLKVNKELEPIEINGQLFEDFLNKNIRLADGRYLNLRNQNPDLLDRGIFVDDNGDQIYLGHQNPEDVRRGVVVSPDGKRVQLIQLQAADLIQDIWRDPETGEISFVNGQPFESLKKLVLVDKKGEKVNLRKQNLDDVKNGKLVTENGQEINFGCPQDKSLLERGLFIGRDGVVRRLADVKWQHIQNGKSIGRRLDGGRFSVEEDGSEVNHQKKKVRFKEYFEESEPTLKEFKKKQKNPPIGIEGHNSSLQKDVDPRYPRGKRIMKKYEVSQGQMIDGGIGFGNLSPGLRVKADHYKFNNKLDRDIMKRPEGNHASIAESRKLLQSDVEGEALEKSTLTINVVNDKEDSFDLSVNVREGGNKLEMEVQEQPRGTIKGSVYKKFNEGSADDLRSEMTYTGIDKAVQKNLYTPRDAEREDINNKMNQKQKLQMIARRHFGNSGLGGQDFANIMGLDDQSMAEISKTSNPGKIT
jgi:hypothetical protein